MENKDAAIEQIQAILDGRVNKVHRKPAGYTGDWYAPMTREELLDVINQLENTLDEANATIVVAMEELGVDHPTWRTLDDYDGSMDNIGRIQAIARGQVHTYEDFRQLVMDLTRCEHGRIQGDNCNGCAGGWSGSREGIMLGYSLSGQKRIVIPSRDTQHDAKEWYK
jgi:hypothetical protein